MINIDKKPNIIFILADDLGYWALGNAGNKEIITPNIDQLALEGTKFENFYCASPVCSPARASLLTGKIPSQHGVIDWLVDKDKPSEAIDYIEEFPGYTDLLKENGYSCGLSGKWHMGNPYKPQKGFDDWFSYTKGSGPYYDSEFSDNGEIKHYKEYVTNLITNRGIEFIESSVVNNTPFYLHLSYTAPHHPWIGNHPEEYLKLYEECEFKSIPKLKLHPNRTSFTDYVEENREENIKGYYASITAMDSDIGRVISKLIELDIYDDTLIVFTSDNGFSCGHHGFWGKGNGTFPLNLYDTSVKVPFIAVHNGKILSDNVVSKTTSAYDVFKTILDYVQVDYSVDNSYPGHSFKNELLQKEEIHKQKVVVYDEYGPNRMVTDGKYKYIQREPYGLCEFYNLENDPNEFINLYGNDKYQDLVIDFKKSLDEWFFKYVDPTVDASKESVYGVGQTGYAGLKSKGKQSFEVPAEIKKERGY